MIDGSKKCIHQLGFELQNSNVFEKHSKVIDKMSLGVVP